MYRFALLVVSLFLIRVAIAQQGPFGFERGMTREQIVKIVGKDAVMHDPKDAAYLLVLTTAPKPHSAFEKYILFISPAAGLLKVNAVGKTIECNAYGTDLKTSFNDVVSGVSKKYREPKILDAHTTELFKEPDQWMMALYDKDRVLEAFWDFDTPMNKI